MKLISLQRTAWPRAQRGVTLVVGLIMLVLITLVVTSAFMLSSTNLKSVGNMQFRDEALAAANKAIEQALASPFTTAPQSSQIDVDIDNNGSNDYEVNIAAPCFNRATQVGGAAAVTGGGSSVSLGFAPAPPPNFSTVWDFDAVVTDSNGSGASIRVRQGVRVLLTQAQYTAALVASACP